MPERLERAFFATADGAEPARDWLKSLPPAPPADTKEIGSDIERIQWRWPVSKPLVGTLRGGLYEVRTKIDTVQYRVLFAIVGSTMVLLHGFVKKSRTAPDEIAIGRARLKLLKES